MEDFRNYHLIQTWEPTVFPVFDLLDEKKVAPNIIFENQVESVYKIIKQGDMIYIIDNVGGKIHRWNSMGILIYEPLHLYTSLGTTAEPTDMINIQNLGLFTRSMIKGKPILFLISTLEGIVYGYWDNPDYLEPIIDTKGESEYNSITIWNSYLLLVDSKQSRIAIYSNKFQPITNNYFIDNTEISLKGVPQELRSHSDLVYVSYVKLDSSKTAALIDSGYIQIYMLNGKPWKKISTNIGIPRSMIFYQSYLIVGDNQVGISVYHHGEYLKNLSILNNSSNLSKLSCLEWNQYGTSFFWGTHDGEIGIIYL